MLAVVVVCLFGIAGCGSAGAGGGSNAGVVARIGDVAVTRAELNRWMGELAAADYYELARGRRLPAGVVSDPPNYGRCVLTLEGLAAGVRGRSAGADLLGKCRGLYETVRRQAMGILVDAKWTEAVLGELGVHASDGEIAQQVQRLVAKLPPGEPRRSPEDLRRIVRIDLLSQKESERLRASPAHEEIRLSEAEQRWTAKTSCEAGYVVKHCKQPVVEPPASAPSAAVLMEQVATIAGTECVNKAACGRAEG